MFPTTPWQSWDVSRPGKIHTNPNLLSWALGSDRKCDIIEIAAEISSSCMMAGLSFWSFDIWRRLGVEQFFLCVEERNHLRWSGHLIRTPCGSLSLEVIQVGPTVRRPQGTPTQSVPSPLSSPYTSHPTKKQISVVVSLISFYWSPPRDPGDTWVLVNRKLCCPTQLSLPGMLHATTSLFTMYMPFFGGHFDRKMIQSMATIDHFPRISKTQRNA